MLRILIIVYFALDEILTIDDEMEEALHSVCAEHRRLKRHI